MLFSGISGSAVADAIGPRESADPRHEEAGLSARHFAAALMAAACVNGPIIPPSIPMVIYGLSAAKGVSVIALFLGGIVPGVMLGLALMVMAY